MVESGCDWVAPGIARKSVLTQFAVALEQSVNDCHQPDADEVVFGFTR